MRTSWTNEGTKLERRLNKRWPNCWPRNLRNSDQELKHESLADLLKDIDLLAAAVVNAQIKDFEFGHTRLNREFFDARNELLPGKKVSDALQDMFDPRNKNTIMACVKHVQAVHLKALLDVYGAEAFDAQMNRTRVPGQSFNIFSVRMTRWIDADRPNDVIAGQRIWAMGNQAEDGLFGYEGASFIVLPNATYARPWGGGELDLPLGQHLVDAWLYRFRWGGDEPVRPDAPRDGEIDPDGNELPAWAKMTAGELMPKDRASSDVRKLMHKLLEKNVYLNEDGDLTFPRDERDQIVGIMTTWRGIPWFERLSKK